MSEDAPTPWIVRLDRAIVQVTGPDAAAFLQGLISNDIGRAQAGALAYAFLLSPQGKYLFAFFIRAVDGGYQLDVAQEDGAALAAKLKQYKLRAKVEIGLREDLTVVALGSGASLPEALPDPRSPVLGSRATVALDGAEDIGDFDYESMRIVTGVPDHHDFVRDQSFLLECNGEELNAVAFRKGCYVGQELTARMKHRGTARRRILRVSGEGLVTGATIMDGTREIGTILSVIGPMLHRFGLATVRLDRWREAGARILTVNGRPAELSLPVYPMSLPAEETPS
jgi:hypothetical protein